MNKLKKILSIIFLSIFFTVGSNFIFAGPFEDYVNNPARTEEELKAALEIISMQGCVLDDFINKKSFIRLFSSKKDQRNGIEKLELILAQQPEVFQVLSFDSLRLEELPDLYRLRKESYDISRSFDLFNEALERFVTENDGLFFAEEIVAPDFFYKWAHNWLRENALKFGLPLCFDLFRRFIEMPYFSERLPILLQEIRGEVNSFLLAFKKRVDDERLSKISFYRSKIKDDDDFLDDYFKEMQKGAEAERAFMARTMSTITESQQSDLEILKGGLDSLRDQQLECLARVKDPHSSTIKGINLASLKKGLFQATQRTSAVVRRGAFNYSSADMLRALKLDRHDALGNTLKTIEQVFAGLYKSGLPKEKEKIKNAAVLSFLQNIKEEQFAFLKDEILRINSEIKARLDSLFAGRPVDLLLEELERRKALIFDNLERFQGLALPNPDLATAVYSESTAEMPQTEREDLLIDFLGRRVVVEPRIGAAEPQAFKLFSTLRNKFGVLDYTIGLFDLSHSEVPRMAVAINQMSRLLLNQSRELKLALRDLKDRGEVSGYSLSSTMMSGFNVPSIELYEFSLNDRADLFHFYYLPYEEFQHKGTSEVRLASKTGERVYSINCFGELSYSGDLRTLGFFELLVHPDGTIYHHFFKPLSAILRSLERGNFDRCLQSRRVFKAAHEALINYIEKRRETFAKICTTPGAVDKEIPFYLEGVRCLGNILETLGRHEDAPSAAPAAPATDVSH